MKACWYVLEGPLGTLWVDAGPAEHLPAMSPRALQELVEYYQNHSLKESFKQLDTTLKYPYKSRERSTSRTFTRSPGRTHLSLSAALPVGNLTRSVGCGLGVNGDLQPPGSSLLPSPFELPCRAQQSTKRCVAALVGCIVAVLPTSACVWGSGSCVPGGV